MIDWDNYNVDSEGKMYYDFLGRFFGIEMEWEELDEKENAC